ncbi:MAG: ribbon-helix-helix protein, CopG family [Deferrisomatales bacterium]|nr:ribbon-helix-helix protein, CopG family [Deferrisomatales bacterium]
MRTVQMTLDEGLVDEVDRVAEELHTTRSAFAREALRQAVERFRTRKLEQRHREGYERRPVDPAELALWEGEHEWGEE